MKQVGRKAASILLTLCMLLTMLPVSALAAASQDCSGGDSCMHEAAIGTTHYDTIGEAIDAANKTSGSGTITVKLLKDATLKGGEQSGHYKIKRILKNITLDLGDNTLTYSENGGFAVDPNCHFTIRNGIYINNSTDEYAQAIEGTKRSYTGPGCTITIAEDAVIQAAYGICADGHTTINVYGKIISTVDGIFGSGPKNKVTLDGAQIEAGVYGVYQQGYDGGSTYTIKNSTITTPSTGATCGVFISNNKDSSEDTEEQGMQTLNIENSVISGQDGIEVRYTNVTISGDQTKVTSAEDGYALGVTHNGSESAVGDLSITGGTFKGVIGFMEGTANTATLTIFGGNFSFAIPEEYCAGGFAPVNNGDGTWSVKEEEETPPEPTGVAQIGEQTYPTLEEAFAAVESSGTIKLLADTGISNTITISASQSIVLDLNGNTITELGEATRKICNNGTLTIRTSVAGGTLKNKDAGSYGLIDNYGTLTIESGTFENYGRASGAAIKNRPGAELLKIEGGEFKGLVEDPGGDQNGYATAANVLVASEAPLTITGGDFSSRAHYSAVFKIFADTADISNVTVSTYMAGGIEVAGGNAVLKDCSFHVSEENSYYANAVAVSGGGTATIDGGTYTGYKYAAYVYNSGGTINIEGGTFGAETVLKADNSTTSNKSVINVTKGDFTGKLEIGSSSTLSISGGTFSVEIPEKYCAEGFVPQENADGTWGVAKKNEAEINGEQYATLSEALNAVKNGETIKVLAPATVNMAETYEITGKAITLYLNGQTVTWNTSAVCAIDVMTGGNLTIQDTSTQETGALNIISTYATSTANSGIRVNASGSLNLTGGTVSYYHANKTGYGAIYLTSGSGHQFTMSGGTVKISGYANYGIKMSGGTGMITGGTVEFDDLSYTGTTYGVYVLGASCTISNLEVDASAVAQDKKVTCIYSGGPSSPVNISGGTYSANNNESSFAVGGSLYSGNGTTITDGTFNGTVDAKSITGGKFSEPGPADSLPEGMIFAKQEGEDYYSVVEGTYVALLGTVGYTSWEELFENASTTTTASAVYILADVNEITVPEGKNVTFYNSGNCTIGKITNNGTCKILTYAMTGTQVVNNGSLNLGHEVASIVNNEGATMKATYSFAKVTNSITNNGTMAISQGTYPCTITNTGTITLTGGSFAQEVINWCEDGYTTQESDGLWVVVKDGPHVAEINGYWYTSLSAAISAAKDGDTVKLLMDTTLTPPATGTGLKSAITISGVSKPNLTLDLNGKTISWDQTYASQTLSTTPVMFSITGGANIKITGNGTIDTELGSNASYGINMTASTKNQLTIENGTFTGAPTAIQVEKGTLTILGGTFKLAKTVAQTKPEQAKYVVNAIDADWKDDSANISIQGGSFCFDPSDNPEGEGSSYVAEGFKAVKNEDGSFEIAKVKVAEVGGVQYTSLADAITHVTNGGTITLLCDFVQNDQLTITDKTFTLDMAGKTITLGKISDNGGAILLNGSSNVTITGNGGFTFNDDYMNDGSSGQMIGVDGNATLTIENGNFDAGLVCVRAGGSAKVYIKGGEYSARAKFDGRMWLLNLQDNEGAKFYVSGGTFKNYDPSNSDTESPADNFCTPEYAATPTKDESGNIIYTVVEAEARIGETGYVTLADAIAAAEDNATITLLADVTEDVVVPAGKNITLDLNEHKITNVADHTITVRNGATLAITGTGTVDNVTHAKAAIWNEGTVTLNGGAYTRSKETGSSPDVSGANSYYNIVNHGTMTINSGVSVTQNGVFSSMIENGYYSYNSGDASSGYVADVNAANPELTINGGTFKGGLNTVKNDDGGKLTINDGTFTNTTQATVLNWNITTITGGTFTAESGNCLLNGALPTSASAQDLGQMTITGGRFTSPGGTACIVNYMSDSKPQISGGSFSEEPKEDYLAPYYDATQNTTGDGYWTVDVAEEYEATWTKGEAIQAGTLDAMLDAANAAKAGTVALLKNVTTQSHIHVSAGVTLDLAGHELDATEFEFTAFGDVVDSTEGEGLLKVAQGSTLIQSSASLPIYDTEQNGYRLFGYQFKSERTYPETVTNNQMGFYFQLTFTNRSAWSLLNTAAETHGIKLSADLQITGVEGSAKVPFAQATIQEVAEQIVDKGDPQENKFFWIIVTSMNKLQDGAQLCVTPRIASDLLEVTAEVLCYPANTSN